MNTNDIGKPIYWDLNKHIEAVIQMIRADEIQIALEMIEKVPAWYRENPDERLQSIKKTLYKNLYDSFDYGNDDDEANFPLSEARAQWTNGYCFPRAEIITALVKELNKKEQDPWIFDLGCSHGNLPLGLKQEGVKFQYMGKSINSRIAARVRELCEDVWVTDPSPDDPKILYCTEVIEHCMNPMDIVQSAYKVGVDWDYILLSVPLGCLGGGLPDWGTRRLGHVRGWTKQEFFDFANKHWPGYKWQLTVAPSMVLLGERNA